MDEKKRILEMVKAGKISVDEGSELLSAMGLPESGNEPGITSQEKPREKAGLRKNRKLRIDVDAGDNADNAKVKVAIPINLVKALLPVIKAGIIPDEAKAKMKENGISIDSVMAAVEEITNNLDDLDEDIVNIAAGDNGDGEKAVVKVYVD